ncbi:biopolymer transporter ExbD [Alcaligenaceae bacterium]|nr:biopolymer transporter ExbD [Alcaligenaceae bacterium]
MAFGSFEGGKNTSHTVSEINMVPLIDVMLVLLVIFMITAPLLSHSIQIKLPQASSQPIEQESVVIDVAVDDAGVLYWNESPVSSSELTLKFAEQAVLDPQPELRIRADLNTRYEVLAQIMSSAKTAGLKRLGFITRPAPETNAQLAVN